LVLGYLVQNPGAIQRDIAQVSRTSAASVTSLLQGLERRGLVERRTEQGNERSKRVYAALHRLLSKITAELPQPTRS
jgi:DNA-binding MarR family transcriptional regulator